MSTLSIPIRFQSIVAQTSDVDVVKKGQFCRFVIGLCTVPLIKLPGFCCARLELEASDADRPSSLNQDVFWVASFHMASRVKVFGALNPKIWV